MAIDTNNPQDNEGRDKDISQSGEEQTGRQSEQQETGQQSQGSPLGASHQHSADGGSVTAAGSGSTGPGAGQAGTDRSPGFVGSKGEESGDYLQQQTGEGETQQAGFAEQGRGAPDEGRDIEGGGERSENRSSDVEGTSER